MFDKNLYFTMLLLGVSAWGFSASFENNRIMIWGVDNQQITIDSGSVITDAVLTIRNVQSSESTLYLHLLDNPDAGCRTEFDKAAGANYFEGAGVSLNGCYENSNLVYRFSSNNDVNSDVWKIFDQPFQVTLADSSTISYSSALLKLIDYIGTGRGFGFGFDLEYAESLFHYNILLDITVDSYTGSPSRQTYQYKLYDLPDTAPYNLLNNPCFENGSYAWCNYSSWNVIEDPNNAYIGRDCIRFSSKTTSSGDYVVYQYANVSPKASYTFSAMLKNNTGKDMQLMIVYLNSAHRYIGHKSSPIINSSEYQRCGMEFTTPQNCYRVIASICVTGIQPNDGTEAYADSCLLYQNQQQ